MLRQKDTINHRWPCDGVGKSDAPLQLQQQEELLQCRFAR